MSGVMLLNGLYIFWGLRPSWGAGIQGQNFGAQDFAAPLTIISPGNKQNDARVLQTCYSIEAGAVYSSISDNTCACARGAIIEDTSVHLIKSLHPTTQLQFPYPRSLCGLNEP